MKNATDHDDATAGTHVNALDFTLMLAAQIEREADVARMHLALELVFAERPEPLEDDVEEQAPTAPIEPCPRPFVRRRPTGDAS